MKMIKSALWLFLVVVTFRAQAATFVVTNGADNGAGTLRAAITNANQAGAGSHTISFNLPSPFQVSVTNALPVVTNTVMIDGVTQPGYTGMPVVTVSGVSGLTHGFHMQCRGGGVQALRLVSFISGTGIILDGPSNRVAGCWITSNVYGISTYPGASNVLIGGLSSSNRNVISGNVFDGISLSGGGPGYHTVVGNYIGLNQFGTAALSNGTSGISISTPNCTVGGTAASARNVISGNAFRGIMLSQGSVNAMVSGNYIGTDVSGSNAVPNGIGVFSFHAASNTVGGGTAAHGNLISGNLNQGIYILGTNPTVTVVQNNKIGLNVSGVALPNGLMFAPNSPGLEINGSSNLVAFNVISGNAGDGIRIGSGRGNLVAANLIGLDSTGLTAIPNSANGIRLDSTASENIIGSAAFRNVISGNNQSGIRISTPDTVGNVVAGNYIGTDISGTQPVSNALHGVHIESAPGTVVGSVAGGGNLISANGGSGIEVSGTGSVGVAINNNLIGTDVSGTNALGNSGSGVSINNAPGVRVGTGGRNVICANKVMGVSLGGGGVRDAIIAGNYIGVASNGVTALGNSYGIMVQQLLGGDCYISNNIISGNAEAGISVIQVRSNLVVAGNVIGMSAGGFGVVSNRSHGIDLFNSGGIRIGGAGGGERNVISGNGGAGIYLGQCRTNGPVVVAGNYIGLDAGGANGPGNGGSGIEGVTSWGIQVGGPAAAWRNHIGKNLYGIYMTQSCQDWWIANNYVGVETSGFTARSNRSSGIYLYVNCHTNLVENNYIAGNNGNGVVIFDQCHGNTIRANRIGLGVSLGIPLPNQGAGVLIHSSANCLVGGLAASNGNVIAHNAGAGVAVVRATDFPGTNNRILANEIYSNATQGIDLNADGITTNDPAPDADSGLANNNQNFPNLLFASPGGSNISGRLISGAGQFRLEFFALPLSGGMQFLGARDHVNLPGGTGAFSYVFNPSLPTGALIVATATSPDGTSEFSAPISMMNPVDTDGDLMPDWWEVANGLNASVTNAAGSDADGDGVTDINEWIADTMANDQNSYLSIVDMDREEYWTLFVPSSEARRYGLEAAGSLTSTTWQVVQNNIPGTGSLLGLIDITSVSQKFYRATAKLP